MINLSPNIKSSITNLSKKLFSLWKLLGFEGIIWITAIIYLSFLTVSSETHFTFCPLSNLGFEHCPGCGLGKSMSLILHGQIKESFNYHYLGVPALIIILFRIYQVISLNYRIHFKPSIKGVNHA